MTAPQPNMTPDRMTNLIIDGFENGSLTQKLGPMVTTMLAALMADADGEMATSPSEEAKELMKAFLGPLTEKYTKDYNEWAESQLFD